MTSSSLFCIAFALCSLLVLFAPLTQRTIDDATTHDDAPAQDDATTTIRDNDTVRVEARASHSHVLRGVRNQRHVLFNIHTSEQSGAKIKRKPVNLVIVLDKSGSMGSENKLQNCQKAIEQVLGALNDDDVVHLVAYDSDVDVVFVNKRLSDLNEMIRLTNQLTPGSMTNLWSGMERALDLLKEFETPERENRVMLFSDGLVNEGPTTTTDAIVSLTSTLFVTERKAKVSSFGIGSDFNEDLMKRMAEVGLGEYYYIRDSESLHHFVRDALGIFLTPIAYDAVLRVRGVNGGVVTEIFGHPDLTHVRLGDLRENNTRHVVVAVDVNDEHGEFASSSSTATTTTTATNLIPFIEYELSYVPLGKREGVVLKGNVGIEMSDDRSVVENGKDGEVAAQVLIAESSKIDEQVRDALTRGDVMNAKNLQRTSIYMMEEAVKEDRGVKTVANSFLKDAFSIYEEIEQFGASVENIKKSHQRKYMKERGCDSYNSMNGL